jgi:hypothetical protein
MSDISYIEVRARRMRNRRWLRLLRGLLLLAVLSAIPLSVVFLLHGPEEETPVTSSSEPVKVMVRSFDGSGPESTGVFVVSAGWVLEWTLDGLASDSLLITVRSLDGEIAGTAVQQGLGTGEQVFDEGGAYRLTIGSTGDWEVRVSQMAVLTGGEGR